MINPKKDRGLPCGWGLELERDKNGEADGVGGELEGAGGAGGGLNLGKVFDFYSNSNEKPLKAFLNRGRKNDIRIVFFLKFTLAAEWKMN